MKHSISSQKSEQNAELDKKDNTSLEHHLMQVKQENYSDTFPEIENWIYLKNIELNRKNKLNERKLYRMKNFFFANKLRLVYTIIVLAILIGACNMPVTQTESAGQIITLVVPGDDNQFETKMYALPWLKTAQVSVNDNVNNGVKQKVYNIMIPNAAEDEVKKYCKELEALGNISTINITPLNYDVKRPLYSAALHGFLSIDIDASGKSDEELKNEMESRLKEQGIDMKFSVYTTPEGFREIKVQSDNMLDMNKEPRSFEINIEDNNGSEKIKMKTKKADPEQFKGKTDKEIREMVKKDMGNQDLKDRDIIIERNGENVQVKIQFDKKEIK